MKIRTLFLLIIAALTVQLGNAQNVGKRVERRAKHRAESKVNREVDRTVDRAVDDVFQGLFGKKKKKTTTEETDQVPQDAAEHEDSEAYDEAEAERQAQAAIARMLGGDAGEWEPIRNEHPVSFDMMITSERKNESTTMQARYTYDTWLLGMQIRQESGEEMLLLLDNEKGTMTTVVEQDGKKQGYRMRRGLIDTESIEDAMGDMTITATGNTKTIDGYLCREYLIESKEGTTNAWMTTEVNADFRSIYGSLAGLAKGKQQDNNKLMWSRDYGVMLEATTVSKDGKEKTFTKISNIKTGEQIDRSILELGDVEIMGIGY